MKYADALRSFFTPPASGNPGEEFAGTDYERELEIKQKALELFWQKNGIRGKPEPVIRSPLSEGYRTTSRRRVFFSSGKYHLGFSENTGEKGVVFSALEPEAHFRIYEFLHEKLNQDSFRALSQALNWIIIRGSYQYQTVIFNVYQMNASVVRKLKQMAEHLQKSSFRVTAAHVYFDPTRSDYYLEANRPADVLAFKSLYGAKLLSLKTGEMQLKYPVTGFSQINESQVPHLLETALRLLQPEKSETLLDLYCGYGLFSFGLGKFAKSVCGIEWEGGSIECAKASARHFKLNYEFMAGRIQESFVKTALSGKRFPAEVQVLDPPRQGCLEGVIPALAARAPKRVLHIFCGTDVIPSELKQWERAGYRVQKAVPLDLFPRTQHLETMVLLTR